jgi:hypothetical protein
MTTRLYTVTIPVNLMVEADSPREARVALLRLWDQVSLDLPTGAGAFMKAQAKLTHIQTKMRCD